jgi:hypothetical protein
MGVSLKTFDPAEATVPGKESDLTTIMDHAHIEKMTTTAI